MTISPLSPLGGADQGATSATMFVEYVETETHAEAERQKQKQNKNSEYTTAEVEQENDKLLQWDQRS